jgi:hypothetical protein
VSRSVQLAISFALVAALAGCASHVESSWRDPSVTPKSLEFRSVIVIAMARDGAMRRAAEDEIVSALQQGPRVRSGQMKATPSYLVLDQSELGDVEAARRKVEAQGYDGAIIVSFVSSEQRITVDPPMHTPMWGYYGYRGAVYDPGSVRSDTIVRIQTNLYSVADGKLLWSGVSRTMNPRNVERLAADVVKDVTGSLREEGLLPSDPK